MKIVRPSQLAGAVVTPGDKSISHRAVLLSALSDGVSTVHRISHGADVQATLRIVTQLGASVTSGNFISIEGPAQGLRATDQVLDCGNSGTTIRLLMGVLAGVPGGHLLTGDASLQKRPMDRVARPLERMGARFSSGAEGLFAPFQMVGSSALQGINYEVPVPSAQVKSAVLLAGLFADGITTVVENIKTRANTEEMLAYAGVSVASTDSDVGRTITLNPGRPTPRDWIVPQDPSQAAFFVVAALLHSSSELTFHNIYGGAERNGYLDALRRMGADISQQDHEGTIDLVVRSSELRGTSIHSSEIPSVDEVPILVVAAAAAVGITEFVDMSELRLKESDRFANSVELARSLGATVEVERDSFTVHGLGSSQLFQVPHSSHPGDHRMTMATAIAGVCGNGATIEFPESTESSFPNFFELLTSLSI